MPGRKTPRLLDGAINRGTTRLDGFRRPLKPYNAGTTPHLIGAVLRGGILPVARAGLALTPARYGGVSEDLPFTGFVRILPHRAARVKRDDDALLLAVVPPRVGGWAYFLVVFYLRETGFA